MDIILGNVWLKQTKAELCIYIVNNLSVIKLIDCWLLYVQWQIFHAYLGREQVQQFFISKKGWDGRQQGNGF